LLEDIDARYYTACGINILAEREEKEEKWKKERGIGCFASDSPQVPQSEKSSERGVRFF
jgi:hypothetical protein